MIAHRTAFVSFVMLPLVAACYVDPMMQPAQNPGTYQQSGVPYGQPQSNVHYGQPAASGAIEAGCTYTGDQLPGDAPIGGTFQVSCPPGCDNAGGGLWGSDVYTSDSSICRAGIHAGAISLGGGVVSVQLQPGLPAYRGSARNGQQSSDYGGFRKSYAVLNAGAGAAYVAAPPAPQPGYQAQPAIYAPPGQQVIEAGCSYSASGLGDAPGTTLVVNCPAGCANVGGLWGTDVYTADSSICRAAIHAGIISPNGGNVAVIIEPGRPAYRGSSRYGVASNDYGAYRKSYRLQPP